MVSEVMTQVALESLIQDNTLLFIEFWAEWCAPCKHFTAIYESVAQQFPKIPFIKLNIEFHKELVSSWGILSVPHLMIIKEGIAVYSDAGAVSSEILKELVQQAVAFNV